MKVEVKKLEQSKVELDVIFTKEEYEVAYNKALDKVLKDVEVPGFRKGKMPKSMYLKRFGDAKIANEAANDLINDTYYKVVSENKINVVSAPVVDLLTDIADDEFGYKATVSVYPEIVAKDYYGIKAKKDVVEITEEKIQAEMDKVLKNNADLEVVEDGAIENGNTVVFDFLGTVDGVEFEGGKAENYELEIGSGKFIPGFEDQMLGMKAGEEKVVKVTFPENYTKELSGKNAEFKVTVHEIKRCVLPEVTDEFVKGLELKDVNTVEEWKAYLANTLKVDAEEAAQNKFEDEVFNKLLENNDSYIPEEMIEEEVEKKVNQLKEYAAKNNIPLQLYLQYMGLKDVDQYKEMVKPSVKSNILYEIILQAIVKQENIELTEEDYEKYYAKTANGLTVEEYKAKYSKEVVALFFKINKVHDLILEKVVQD